MMAEVPSPSPLGQITIRARQQQLLLWALGVRDEGVKEMPLRIPADLHVPTGPGIDNMDSSDPHSPY